MGGSRAKPLTCNTTSVGLGNRYLRFRRLYFSHTHQVLPGTCLSHQQRATPHPQNPDRPTTNRTSRGRPRTKCWSEDRSDPFHNPSEQVSNLDIPRYVWRICVLTAESSKHITCVKCFIHLPELIQNS